MPEPGAQGFQVDWLFSAHVDWTSGASARSVRI